MFRGLHGPRTQAYGETRYRKQSLSARQNQALHGPQTQAYGETRHRKQNLSARQNQGIA